MQYGVNDSRQLSASLRLRKRQMQEKLLSVRQESGKQRELSLQTFHSALDSSTKLPQPKRPKPAAALNSDKVTIATNGPTREGSILYNGEAVLLLSIGTLSKQRPKSKFHHLRSSFSSYPHIQQILAQSNRDYRLSITTSESGEEDEMFRLVRMGAEDAEVSEMLLDGRLKTRGADTSSDLEQAIREADLLASERKTYPRQQAGGTQPQQGEDFLDNKSSSLIPFPPTTRPESDISKEWVSPPSHCWVDDVTVSSDAFTATVDLAIQRDVEGFERKSSKVPAHPGSHMSQQRFAGLRKKEASHISEMATSALLKPSSNLDKDQNIEAAGSKSTEEERQAPVAADDDQVTLPRFMCPSSETKSRQEAVKQWLAKTSFSAARRSVPLL